MGNWIQRRVLLPFLASAFASILAPFDVPGQSLVTISTPPACSECVNLEPVVTLGETEGPAIIESLRTSAYLGPDSTFYVYENLGSKIKVFSPNGEYLETIGRAGQGPGEFEGISAVRAATEGEIHVFDLMAQRLTIYHPEADSLSTKTLPFRPEFGIEVLEDGGIVAASHVRTPERVGFPLQHFSPQGDWRSFGSSGAFRPDMLYNNGRAISLAGDGNSVWAAFRGRYNIEKWSLEGERLLEIHRPVDWFPPQTTSRREPDYPPPQIVGQIQAIGNGLLWVVLLVADPDWRDAWIDASGAHGSQSIGDINKYFDTVVELIDYEAGTVVASGRFDRLLGAFVGPNLISEPIQDSLGTPFIAIRRLIVSH